MFRAAEWPLRQSSPPKNGNMWGVPAVHQKLLLEFSKKYGKGVGLGRGGDGGQVVLMAGGFACENLSTARLLNTDGV